MHRIGGAARAGARSMIPYVAMVSETRLGGPGDVDGSDHSRLLVVVPTVPEARAVSAALGPMLREGLARLAVSGMGAASVEALCRQLDTHLAHPRAVVLVGWGGGLTPSLDTGSAVIADVALDEEGHRAPCVPVQVAGGTIGPGVTVAAPLYTAAEKRVWLGTGALVLDMEAYPAAAWCAMRDVPFVHARVILDAHDEDIPDLGDALDPLGRVRPTRLARILAAHPSEMALLVRLARRTRSLAPALGRLARDVVDALPASGGEG
jgi:hypothetical protein